MILLKQGGPILIAIFILSTFAWFLIVYKWLHLKQEVGNIDWIHLSIKNYDKNKIKEWCSSQSNLIARMAMEVFAIYESGLSFTRKRRQEIISRESNSLHRNLNLISSISSILPLLGLLGTVLGMTKTFQGLNLYKSQETNHLMAGGISEALITTQAGLIAALPIILMHEFLHSRIRRSMDKASLFMNQLISKSQENQDV